MSDAELWVQQNLADAPAPVAEAMLAAVRGSAGEAGPALVEAALREYGRVLEGDGSRDDANPLLIADALLTHAFQAEAQAAQLTGPSVEQLWYEGLRQLADRLD